MLRLLTSRRRTGLIDAAVWGGVHLATAYLAHRLPPERLREDTWLLRPRRFEQRGRWYDRRWGIARWKDHLPDGGEVFPGGVGKRHLPSPDDAGLTAFVQETRRAERAHWWALAAGPAFLLWNPPLATTLLVSYGVVVNLPFIAVQRHNRLRATALLEARGRRADAAVEAGRGAGRGVGRAPRAT